MAGAAGADRAMVPARGTTDGDRMAATDGGGGCASDQHEGEVADSAADTVATCDAGGDMWCGEVTRGVVCCAVLWTWCGVWPLGMKICVREWETSAKVETLQSGRYIVTTSLDRTEQDGTGHDRERQED